MEFRCQLQVCESAEYPWLLYTCSQYVLLRTPRTPLKGHKGASIGCGSSTRIKPLTELRRLAAGQAWAPPDVDLRLLRPPVCTEAVRCELVLVPSLEDLKRYDDGTTQGGTKKMRSAHGTPVHDTLRRALASPFTVLLWHGRHGRSDWQATGSALGC